MKSGTRSDTAVLIAALFFSITPIRASADRAQERGCARPAFLEQLTILDHEEPCTGYEGQYKCLLTRDRQSGQTEFFYEPIDNFKLRIGFVQDILVWNEPNPESGPDVPDAPCRLYTRIETLREARVGPQSRFTMRFNDLAGADRDALFRRGIDGRGLLIFGTYHVRCDSAAECAQAWGVLQGDTPFALTLEYGARPSALLNLVRAMKF